jgi:hypothetical protein
MCFDECILHRQCAMDFLSLGTYGVEGGLHASPVSLKRGTDGTPGEHPTILDSRVSYITEARVRGYGSNIAPVAGGADPDYEETASCRLFLASTHGSAVWCQC